MNKTDAAEILQKYVFDDEECIVQEMKDYNKALKMAISALSAPQTDLISRSDVVNEIQRYERHFNTKLESLYVLINELPSADAVSLTGTMKYLTKPHNYCEVVRCKDCKRRQTDECLMYYEEWYEIDEGDGYADTGYIIHDYTRDDGFCHHGERREE